MLLTMRSIINREININKYCHKIFCCNEMVIYLENIHMLDIFGTITNINGLWEGIQFVSARIDAIILGYRLETGHIRLCRKDFTSIELSGAIWSPSNHWPNNKVSYSLVINIYFLCEMPVILTTVSFLLVSCFTFQP